MASVSLKSPPFLSFQGSIRSVSSQIRSLHRLGALELRNVAIYFKLHMNHDIRRDAGNTQLLQLPRSKCGYDVNLLRFLGLALG